MRIAVKLLLPLLTFSIAVSAQFELDYKPVTSQGTLPKDFVTLSADKYKEAKTKLSKSEKGSARKTAEQFLLESNFGIDDILLSGKVLFNDPMADYVNKVADKALQSEPNVRRDLRFYVYKSTAVNAFSTNQGVVLVTTGLLAQLENEAQLAFILTHEAVHYKEKHAIKKYVESDMINRGKGAYEQLNPDRKLLAKSTFSKEEEKEADEKGLLIYLQSKYSTANLIGVYDVLKYAYLPFDDLVWDKSFLENSTLKFPDDYYKKTTLAIDTKDISDDDDRSTHPSIKSRREKTLDGIKGADNTGKSDYQVGEAEFNKVREIARFELCRLYALHGKYEFGIYTSYMLLKKYPQNLYLKKNIAFCLTGLAQYSNETEFKAIHYNSDSIEGKSQALFYLMFRLDSVWGDLNIVALAYLAKLKNDYPADEEIGEYYTNLMYALVHRHSKAYSDFSATAYVPPSAADTLIAKVKPSEPPRDTDVVGKSKYEKLREQKVETEIKKDASGYNFSKYAFVEFMNKDWFKKDFADAQKELTAKDQVDIKEELNRRNKYWDKRIYALGYNKIVVVDPIYSRIDARKKDKYKYIQSEAGQVDFAERLKLNAKKAKLEIEVLNTKNLAEEETDKLNDVAAMDDYITERLSHPKSVVLPYSEREHVKALAKKYGTDYFVWTGAVSLSDVNRMNVLRIMFSCIFPVVLPWTLPGMINGGEYTLYFTLVYDVKTDELKMASYREIRNRTAGYILNSHIYDVFSQIKAKGKSNDKK